MNWLVELSKKAAPVELIAPEIVDRTSHLDLFVEKIAEAEKMGRRFAREMPDLLEKEANFMNGALSAVKGMVPKVMPAVKNVATKGLTMAAKNPGTALTLGGAAAGGLAGAATGGGVDPATGQRKGRLGRALVGAGLGAAAGAGSAKIPGVTQRVTGLAEKGLSRLPMSPSAGGGPIQGSASTWMGDLNKYGFALPAGLAQTGGKALKFMAAHPKATMAAGGAAFGAAAGGPNHRGAGLALGAGSGAALGAAGGAALGHLAERFAPAAAKAEGAAANSLAHASTSLKPVAGGSTHVPTGATQPNEGFKRSYNMAGVPSEAPPSPMSLAEHIEKDIPHPNLTPEQFQDAKLQAMRLKGGMGSIPRAQPGAKPLEYSGAYTAAA